MKIFKIKNKSAYLRNIIILFIFMSLLFNTLILIDELNGTTREYNEKTDLEHDIINESFEIDYNEQIGLKNIYNERIMKDSEFTEKNPFTTKQKTVVESATQDSTQDTNFPISFSNLFGGEGRDKATAVTVDSSNNIIVTGCADVGDFPILNAFDSTYNGFSDVFVTKFNSTGSLLWSTYLGGSDSDEGSAITVDSLDNIIVTGETSSSDFPTLNASDSTFNGISDGFITKFKPDGSLLWSTYLGGTYFDEAVAVTVDSSDNMIVTGTTSCSDFPIFGASDNTFNGRLDVFVTKFNSTGSLLWSTYLGGSEIDEATAVAIDSSNNIIVTGFTDSVNFPTLNAYNNTHGGKGDVFVTKFNSTGSILWSTYIGGLYDDKATAIAVDSSDNIIVTGYTESLDFPTLNAYDSTLNGYHDVLVIKLSSNGSLLWSTYLGGYEFEFGHAITVDSSDNIIVTGYTFSTDFPTLNALQGTTRCTGERCTGECFISVFSSSGFLITSTYLGGSDGDYSRDSTIDKDGNIIVIGCTDSVNNIDSENDFPITNDDLLSSTANDACFVIKFTSLAIPLKINDNYTIQFSNLLGGNSGDSHANGVTIDHSGNTIVVGYTRSSDFTTLNANSSYYKGAYDIFITKFINGSFLWSTFLGGSQDDYSSGVAVDSFDNIIVTGYTFSPDFPILNANDSSFDGGLDAFVTKFSSDGLLLWSTYLGGSSSEYGSAITVDSLDNIIVTGETSSSDFPTRNAYEDTLSNGSTAIFVTKFSDTGFLFWSTFLGKSGACFGGIVAVDHFNNIIVTGMTTANDFPTLNAYDSDFNGGIFDVFITKFSSDGLLLWSTFLGGSGRDESYAVTVDSSDNIIVTGFTDSVNFPTLNASDSTLNGTYDIFVTKYTCTGTLLWSTYLGGSSSDFCSGVIVNSLDEIFLAGFTSSLDFSNDSSVYYLFDGTYCYLTIYDSNGELLENNVFGGLTDIYCNSLAYNSASDEIALVGYVTKDNTFFGKTYPDIGIGFDNAFVIILLLNSNNEVFSSFQTILSILPTIILVFVIILFSFTSYIIINFLIDEKRKIQGIKSTISETKNLARIEDFTVDIDSPLWNIAKEFNNFERKKGFNLYKMFIKFSTESMDKAIFDLPSSLEPNDEKLLISLNKVILRRNENLFLSYLNSKIYNRITQGSFTLLSPDHNFMVKCWSIPYFSLIKKNSNLNGLQITDEHHQLFGSLITELETLTHLQWELLPHIAKLFDNILSFSAKGNTKEFYVKKVITPLSLEFKIDFLENIYKNVLNYNYNSIETILRTISVSNLLNLSENEFEAAITRILELDIIEYPLPFQTDDIVEIPYNKRQILVSAINSKKIKINNKFLSKLLR